MSPPDTVIPLDRGQPGRRSKYEPHLVNLQTLARDIEAYVAPEYHLVVAPGRTSVHKRKPEQEDFVVAVVELLHERVHGVMNVTLDASHDLIVTLSTQGARDGRIFQYTFNLLNTAFSAC